METARRRMPNRWTLESDLNARLSGCHFIFDGRYVQIQAVSSSCLNIHDGLTQEIIEKISPDDPRLDVSSIELGYANIPTSAGLRVVYTYRATSKRWKQGIDTSNVCIVSTSGEHLNPVFSTPDGRSAYYIMSAGFRDSVLGRFPTIGVALSSLSKGMPEIAVSQSYVLKFVSNEISLILCRNEAVGHIVDGSLRIEERASSFIVREDLETLGLKVHHA